MTSPVPDYAHAQCAAITKAGRRCSGRWSTALPVTFAWDPVTGRGTDGPWVVLCHRHRHWDYEGGISAGKRYRIAHDGWLGASNKYNYGSSVFAAPDGWAPAAWWWAHRRASTFGDVGRRDAA